MTMPGTPHAFPAVVQQPSYPALEREILDFWRADGTFEASVEARPGGSNEYVFYDGPPFANGLPHYGHLLTGFVKDAVPRYKTMRGRRVERRFGWDCHGLPAEMAAEKELGLSGRAGVYEYGVDKFNEHCRALVQATTGEWRHYVTRQGRWVDFDNDYKTMDLPYVESVMWAFKALWDKGLVYEGYRVLPYCWECETPLSNFETRQDDSYRPREDPAVTVAFELEPDDLDGDDPAASSLRALVWTTTPWTLPSNLALAVGEHIDYAVVQGGGGAPPYLVAAARLHELEDVLGPEPQVLATVKGERLVGRRYRPLFDYFAGTEGAFRVLGAEFVQTDEGTGVVHLAPGFGEDDQRACESEGIPVVCPVDGRGRFTDEVADYAGLQVFDANQPIIEALGRAGALVSSQKYTHSYPHCWRTDTPLIYRAVSSWFVRVTAVRDRMVELNQQIHWVPAHVRDGAFGKWLEGARDWSISRNRFWGSPIPVWKSDDPRYPRTDVYGSLDELEADFGVRPTDLHRPAIDALTRPNPDDPTGRSTMRRVEDVLDCWFDSGSMPFAQLHYPFENKERFESHFPADFIVEYVAQTRGWFYTLHVLATALFDRPAFQTCVAHGIVLGDDGRKLSKRLRNFPDPIEVFETYGADAMRWFLLSSPCLRGQNLIVERKGMEDAVRQAINPVWNAWYFLSLYARADGVEGRVRTDMTGLLDRYILAKAAELVAEVTATMDAYDLDGSTAAVTGFLDALNNWYIRRSRDRFWRPAGVTGAEEADKLDAYDTLTTVLGVLCRICAPLLPMTSEAIYRGLTGDRSVHLTDWPGHDELPRDVRLVTEMDRARDVCSAAHSVRKSNGLRARLPLSRLTVAAPDAGVLEPYVHLIRDEVNVQQVILSDDVDAEAEAILTVEPAAIGPRLGPDTQTVLAAARQGNWTQLADGTVEVAGLALREGEFRVGLRPRDEEASRALGRGVGVVTVDLQVTPELRDEGLARDVVRVVQMARREAGLSVSDRVRLGLELPAELHEAVSRHADMIRSQTLATELVVGQASGSFVKDATIGGAEVRIALSPV